MGLRSNYKLKTSRVKYSIFLSNKRVLLVRNNDQCKKDIVGMLNTSMEFADEEDFRNGIWYYFYDNFSN